MSIPQMAGWNLGLRFGLEVAALTALGTAAWRLNDGATRWIAVLLVPAAAATVWGVFNVLDDPSRSGAAPVEVPGWIRLGVELLVLGGGALAVVMVGRTDVAAGFVVLIAVHYAASWTRIEWLLEA